jgi:thymidine kinase
MDTNELGKGSISIIIGCMFSGKSTEIIRLIKRYQNIPSKKLLLINHSFDNRYGESVISTHDRDQIKCKSLSELSIIKETEDYKNSNVIFIEEGQFFKDLYKFSTNAADNDNKEIIISGLDGDFKRGCFGDLCRLIPHAENIKKLNALCAKCQNGKVANFTKRIVSNPDQKLIGSFESYIPVCRFHFINN